jgi:hypothetical protein
MTRTRKKGGEKVDIKPIETVYNGYRFRSRLEARWAVFFDAAGIEYQYELEGYKLGNGKWYLPDFYLPKFDAYVEIKRNNLDEDEFYDAEDNCLWLYTETGKLVLLCQGDPVDMNMSAFFGMYESPLGFHTPGQDYAIFVEGARYWKPGRYDDGKMFIEEHEDGDNEISIVVGEDDYNIADTNDPPTLINKCLLRGYTSLLESARKKARQARFEHGETPRVRR